MSAIESAEQHQSPVGTVESAPVGELPLGATVTDAPAEGRRRDSDRKPRTKAEKAARLAQMTPEERHRRQEKQKQKRRQQPPWGTWRYRVWQWRLRLRSIHRTPAIRDLLVGFVKFYVDIVGMTTRWSRDLATLDAALADGRPVIFCCWHGRQLMMPRLWGARGRLAILGSESRDGMIALEAGRRFGFEVILRAKEGERRREGGRVARQMLTALKGGSSVGLTPDGSRGPRMRLGLGTLQIAALSGAAIVPAAYACRLGLIAGNWDRMLLPLPFGRGVMMTGAVFTVPRDATPQQMEAARAELEERMNALTREADEAVGRRPVLPEGAPET